MEEESSWYVRACKNTARQWIWAVPDPVAFSRKCEKSVSQEYRDALRFTGFDLEAFETVLFSYFGTFATLILLLGIDLFLLLSRSFDARNSFYHGNPDLYYSSDRTLLSERVCEDQGRVYENILPRRHP